nr:hypothetical protein [uncultured Desulfobacter sp.]
MYLTDSNPDRYRYGISLIVADKMNFAPKATTKFSQAMIRRSIGFCLPTYHQQQHGWRRYTNHLYKITTSQCYHVNRLGPADRRVFALVFRLYTSVHTYRKLFAMVRTFPANHAPEHRCEVSKKYPQL